jgi:hypothetical protein
MPARAWRGCEEPGIYTASVAPMRMDRTETIAGLPVLRVRDFLRWAYDSTFTWRDLRERLKVSRPKALDLQRELLERKLIEPAEHAGRNPGQFRVAQKGRRLAAASAIPPIPRDKARRCWRSSSSAPLM